jgi:hypothetical protein
MYIFLVNYLGIEPRTFRLKAEYSTIELVIQLKIVLIIQYFYRRD